MEYLYACWLGVVRTAVLMPIEHPLDYLKTQIQAQSYQGPVIPFLSSHIKSQGFLKLYTGFLPNTLRASIKQGYRLPLMVGIPNFYRRFLGSENSIQILTGLTIAIIESYIICPLERLKVWLMTSPVATLSNFVTENRHMNELLRGINALLVRQTMSWVSFLGFTSVFKEGTLRYKGRIEGNDILWIGVLVGIINTAVIMPADFIKTDQQKFREINKGGLWEAYRLLTEKEATGIGNHLLWVEGKSSTLYV